MEGYVMATTPTGANIGHCMAEAPGTPCTRFPTGVACALATPYVMDYNMPACIDRLLLVAEAMGLVVDGLSKKCKNVAIMTVQDGIELVLKDVELPTSLREAGVSKGRHSKSCKIPSSKNGNHTTFYRSTTEG